MACMMNYVYAVCVCDLNEVRVFILHCVGIYEFDDLEEGDASTKKFHRRINA